MKATLEVPAILVGLGAFGARVVERVASERAELIGEGSDPVPFATLTFGGPLDAELVAARVTAQARALLAHGRMVAARDRREGEGLTRLHVFVVAHLGEPEVRDGIADILADAQRRLLTELGPIFEAFRTGARRNLVLLPLCAMPHPAGVESGMQVATAARDLARSIAKTPPRERAIPQLFLVEDVAEFSVLSDADLAQCVRNFLTLLLYSLSAVERVSALLYGDQPGEPLATFVCAVCELPRKALCTWAVDGIALEVLDAVLAEREDDVSLAALDALEDVELAAFDEPKDADRDVLALLERYAPPQARDPEPAWWERAETLRARYGPDPGDPSSDDEQPPPHPPVGWALSVMREIEKTWRTLQRRRFDDLIAQERDEVQRRRDVLLGAVEQKVDQTLWRDPAPESFRRAAALARQMERAVSLRLEDAIRDRDAARPVPPPSFDHFRAAHAAYLDAARRKPDLARMIVYGVLFVIAFTTFLPLPLRNLAEALRIAEGAWQSPWLRERAWLTAALASAVPLATFLSLRYRAAHLAVRKAFHAMFDALEQTVEGLRDSVLEYFASRLRLARQVARVDALLGVRAAILDDQERLTVLDRAARKARSRLLESLGKLGVERKGGALDLSGLTGAGAEALVESMLPKDAARLLEPLLPPEERDARVRDALFAMARDERYAQRWREEVPFTSLDALRRSVHAHARPVLEWSPFATPASAEALATQIAAFARRQARSLSTALNVSGHDAKDETGVTRALDGELIAPPPAFDLVRRALTDEGAAGRARIPARRGIDPDRAFYVVALTDIDERAVPSLQLVPRGGAPHDEAAHEGGSQDKLRFEIEEG